MATPIAIRVAAPLRTVGSRGASQKQGVTLGSRPRNSELMAGVGCPSPATATLVRRLGIHICKRSWGIVIVETLFPLLRVEKQAAFSTDSMWFLIHKKNFFLTSRRLDCK